MKAGAQDKARLEAEAWRVVEQLKALGAVQVILFGSQAREVLNLVERLGPPGRLEQEPQSF